MTKYLDKSFNSPPSNKNYRDNYDQIFRPSPRPPGTHIVACQDCGEPINCVEYPNGCKGSH